LRALAISWLLRVSNLAATIVTGAVKGHYLAVARRLRSKATAGPRWCATRVVVLATVGCVTPPPMTVKTSGVETHMRWGVLIALRLRHIDLLAKPGSTDERCWLSVP
jgi:hypothetical protein